MFFLLHNRWLTVPHAMIMVLNPTWEAGNKKRAKCPLDKRGAEPKMDNKDEACPIPSKDQDDRVRGILSQPRTVAVVGMSPKKERPSNEVGLYLRDHGFSVIPVHPKAEEIEGLKVYPSLEAIPADCRVEIVDLFVTGDIGVQAVEQAAKIGAKIVWFQPGTENPEAEKRALDLGLEVFSGRCTKADHERFFG